MIPMHNASTGAEGVRYAVRKAPKSNRPRPHLRVDLACDHCNRQPAPHCHVWVPSPEYQARVGAPPGKVRCVCYRLCSACANHRTPQQAARIQRHLLAEFAIRLQQPGRN
jgi:hypothetical protein